MTIQEFARAMINATKVGLFYWAEAVMTVCYAQNRLSGKATSGKIPCELWFERKPFIQHLRVFGCVAFAHTPKEKLKHSKLSDRSRKMMMIRYSDNMKAYKLINPNTMEVEYTRSVTFHEGKFYANVSDEQWLNQHVPQTDLKSTSLESSDTDISDDEITPEGETSYHAEPELECLTNHLVGHIWNKVTVSKKTIDQIA